MRGNLIGLIPVVVAIALLIWIMVLGLAQTSELPERVGLVAKISAGARTLRI